MKWTSLHTIVEGYRIQRGYPIHYYTQFLYLSSRVYEEINFDSLQNIKTAKLPVNEFNEVAVPCDFMDWVKVGVASGQLVRNLSPREGINRLANINTTGNQILYGNPDGVSIDAFDSIFFRGYNRFYNGVPEIEGRLFGRGLGSNPHTFTFVKERGVIQLYEGLQADHIILQYITDGSSVDNATLITPYAKSTIETGIEWKRKDSSRLYSPGEVKLAHNEHDRQHKVLRARIYAMGREKILNIARRNSHGAIKG